MGFDVYGKAPQLVSERPDIDWEKDPSDQERDKFFKDLEQFEQDNPGYYFRNNVWWWTSAYQSYSRVDYTGLVRCRSLTGCHPRKID